MRFVIEGPAALPDVQVTFEGALVGDLLFEIRGQVGGLPLLAVHAGPAVRAAESATA